MDMPAEERERIADLNKQIQKNSRRIKYLWKKNQVEKLTEVNMLLMKNRELIDEKQVLLIKSGFKVRLDLII